MVVSRWCEPSGLVGATVTGAVTRTDQTELVSYVKAAIVRFQQVRLLIRVERYAGRHHDWRFDPDALWNGRDGEGISMIAVVGEPAWKTIAPVTSRHRRVPIEYFPTECAARCWLDGPSLRRDGRCPFGMRGLDHVH